MESTELKVDGMTCGSCVAAVTRALKRVPGVQDVEVDLQSGVARVRGEQVAQQLAMLVAAVGEAGYGAGAGAGAGAPAAPQRPAGGCGADAASKGRGGCCCG